jgi:rRNA biogenesis protein RRP5
MSMGLLKEQGEAEAADDNVLDNGPGTEDVDMNSDPESSDEEEMQIDIDSHQVEYKATTSSSNPVEAGPILTSLGGFHWSGNSHSDEENVADSSSSEDDDNMSTKPTKKKRKRKQIEQDLTADLHTKQPESNTDFERLLLGSPNSSYLWIQYMSFQLPLSEVDKAREIARRAIKTINFREEQERLNVWIALLNLENVYGTNETLEAVFKEATKANDSKPVHLRLASIFEQSDKPEVRLLIYQSLNILEFVYFFCRKQRNNTNERVKNSAKAPKYGHYSDSSSCNEVKWRKQGNSYLARCRASRSGNVCCVHTVVLAC